MEALDVVRAVSQAFAEGGAAATAPFLADDLRWFPGLVRGEVAVRGKQAYLDHHATASADGVAIGADQQDLRDLGGGRVLISGELVVSDHGREERRPMFWLMTVAGELIVSIAAHDSEAEALRSVGLEPAGAAESGAKPYPP